MMKKNARFNYLMLIYLAGMVFFTLFRLAETAVYCSMADAPDNLGTLYWRALWKGFRFDTAVSCYILILPLVMLILGELAHIRKKWYYAIAHYYLMVVYTVCFFACAADIPYFCYFFQRLDAQVLTMDSSLPVVIDMIVSEPAYIFYFFVFLAVAVGWWLLGRWIFRRQLVPHLDQRLPLGWAVGVALVLSVGLFTGMRGHLSSKPPLRAEHAVYCNDPFLNQIGLNPVFTFMKSAVAIRNEQKHPLDLIDLDTARRVFASREAVPATDNYAVSLPQGTNVVLILMESMASEKTSIGSSPEATLTPHLDGLMRSGITFTGLFSAGTQTFNGIYSTLYGHPAILKRHTMHHAIMPHMCGLPQLLCSAGYSTAYFMPHQGYFDGMESFLFSNGFEQVFEQSSYPQEEWINSYGIPDHLLFRHALEYINTVAADGPFFTTIMTCSDHPPYVLPDNIPFSPSRDELTSQMVEYADWSIGQFMAEASRQPWFENTLFVFVADHGCFGKNPRYDIALSRNRIPLVLYAPGRIAPSTIVRPALQIDVAPTVLGMLGIGYGDAMIGIDILHYQRPYAFFGSGNMIGATDGEMLYIYRHENRSSSLYRFKDESAKDIAMQNPDSLDAMRSYALGMVQMSYQMLRDGTTDCKQVQ